MAEPRDSHSTSFAVRDAIESDLDGILDLYTHLHAHDTAPPPYAQMAEIWSDILANPSLRYFVVACGDRVVSSCNLAVIPNLTRGARSFGVIENVVTHPDYRKRGFAQAVLEYALDAAWQSGCYKVIKKGVKTGFVAYPSD
jgi:GNAT superfamily N-acetyltransferase